MLRVGGESVIVAWDGRLSRRGEYLEPSEEEANTVVQRATSHSSCYVRYKPNGKGL